MIRFFSITGGLSNTLINNFIKENNKIIFDNSKNENSENIIKKLNSNGYYINENFLENDKIENILNELKNLKGRYSGDNVEDTSISKFSVNKNLNSTRFT